MTEIQPVIDKIMEYLPVYGMRVLMALLILVVGKIISKFTKSTVGKMMIRSKVDTTLISFTTSLLYITLMVFVIIASLGQLGIQTTSFVAIIGAAGLAIGLALQGSLSNFASGVLMIIFRPFKVGDFIEGGGATGVVEEISIFTTTILTPDNKEIIVPNSKVSGDNIINYSAKGKRRVDLTASCSYSDNLSDVKTLLEKICNDDSRVLAEPKVQVGVLEMADSSINFVVRPWVKTEDYWALFFDLNQKIKEEFDKVGVSIPFPQQDIHLHTIKEG